MSQRLQGFALALAMVLQAGVVHGGAGPVVTSPMVFVPQSVLPDIQGPKIANQAATDQIVQRIQAAASLCSGVGEAYRVDCLADQLASTAAALPDTGDYAEAKAAIADAAAKMHALARANADRSAPRVTARMGDVTTSRPIIPVTPEAQADVNAQADAILSEASTVLLRSADSSPELQDDYVQIATAIGSTKVLLRST